MLTLDYEYPIPRHFLYLNIENVDTYVFTLARRFVGGPGDFDGREIVWGNLAIRGPGKVRITLGHTARPINDPSSGGTVNGMIEALSMTYADAGPSANLTRCIDVVKTLDAK